MTLRVSYVHLLTEISGIAMAQTGPAVSELLALPNILGKSHKGPHVCVHKPSYGVVPSGPLQPDVLLASRPAPYPDEYYYANTYSVHLSPLGKTATSRFSAATDTLLSKPTNPYLDAGVEHSDDSGAVIEAYAQKDCAI
ncbi:hypothetical protein PM082_015251 [Marasmius tenuissimus]|nr:hypothetical protein PM082_015251 [Marasmius tenuissimus]